MLRCFAIGGAWLGGGREVYFGAEGVREGIGGSGKKVAGSGVAMRKQGLCRWL